MSLFDEIKSVMQEQCRNSTQDQYSKKIGISQGHLNHLMNGKRKIESISLGTFFKIFPNASVKINGDTVVTKNSGINNGVMGINHGTVNTTTDLLKDSSLDSIMDKILSSEELSAEEKVKVLKVLKK